MAHNDYVRYLAETGAVGLALFVGVLTLLGTRLVRMLRRSRNTPHYMLIGVAFALFMAWVLGGIGDNVISYTAFQVYLWALLAAASAAASDAAAPKIEPADAADRTPPSASLRRERIPGAPRRIAAARATRGDDTSSSPPTASIGGRNSLKGGSRGKLSLFLAMLAAATPLTAGIGFYLWNRGLTVEAYYLGWLLVYGAIAVVLREEGRRYIRTLLLTALAALVSVQAQFALPEFGFQSATSLSLLIVGGLAVFGAIEACVGAARSSRRSAWNAMSLGLLPLALLLAAGMLVPAHLLPDRFPLFAWTIRGEALFQARDALLGNGRFAIVYGLMGFLVGVGALGFASNWASHWSSGSTPVGGVRALIRASGQELQRFSTEMLLALRNFGRRTLLPLACLATVAFALHRLLASIGAFLDGDPFAFATWVGWLSLIFVSIGLLAWGISSEGVRPILRRWARSSIAVLVVVHVSSLVATVGLWAISKLLPVLSAVERFAPLHRQRTPGLYTWIASTASLALLLTYGLWRRRRIAPVRPGHRKV